MNNNKMNKSYYKISLELIYKYNCNFKESHFFIVF